MSSSSNDNTKLHNEKIEIKNPETVNLDKKHPQRFSIIPQSLRKIFNPANPTFLQRTFKPALFFGILLGFSITYYYHANEIMYFLDKQTVLMNAKLDSLNKEIIVLSKEREKTDKK